MDDEICQDCGKVIGQGEEANVWNGERIVCSSCLRLLQEAEAASPGPLPPTISVEPQAVPLLVMDDPVLIEPSVADELESARHHAPDDAASEEPHVTHEETIAHSVFADEPLTAQSIIADEAEPDEMPAAVEPSARALGAAHELEAAESVFTDEPMAPTPQVVPVAPIAASPVLHAPLTMRPQAAPQPAVSTQSPWFIEDQGMRYGPLTTPQAIAHLRRGMINTGKVWRAPMKTWRPAMQMFTHPLIDLCPIQPR